MEVKKIVEMPISIKILLFNFYEIENNVLISTRICYLASYTAVFSKITELGVAANLIISPTLIIMDFEVKDQ